MFKKEIVSTIASAVIIMSVAMPAFAATTTSTVSTASKIACVGAAVQAREQAIDSAINTYTQAIDAAYAARAVALGQAYSKTVANDVKTATKNAWTVFNSSMKSGRKAWQTARDKAWSSYRTSATACKAPSGVGDGANSGSEVSGQ